MKPSVARGLHAARRSLIAPGRLQRPYLVHSAKISHRWNSSSSAAQSTVTNSSSASTTVSPSENAEKPFYITTPIFYVNSDPHIGHYYTALLADILKRWYQLKGRQVFLSTGTDEHGTKIQIAADSEGITPQELVDCNSELFKILTDQGKISHDAFIRTTDPKHKGAVSYAFSQLRKSMLKELGLYKGTHQGWYSVIDECFYPESATRTSIIPQTGKKIRISMETENEVQFITEETWFFPLSKYKQRLLDWYNENPHWIIPRHHQEDMQKWISENLKDLAVTRPLARLSWGIRDPGDDKQTIYVWIDALINYLTVCGYGSKWHSRNEPMGAWPPDLQVIGKDILRFHAVYWPALLMALDLPLPKKILCHDHWTMSNRKMSKSIGNVVNPFFAMQRWDVDPFRYCLLRSSCYNRNMDYSNTALGVTYTKELQASLGNMLYRITRPKMNGRWSLKEAVADYKKGAFDRFIYVREAERQLDRYYELSTAFLAIEQSFDRCMELGNVPGAMRLIFELLLQTNAFFTQCSPWQLLMTDRARSRTLLHWIIFNAAEAIRVVAILLQPIMPGKAAMVLDELKVRQDRRTREWAHKCQDSDYGDDSLAQPSVTALAEQGVEAKERRFRKWDAIFPPTVDSRVSDAALRAELRRSTGITTPHQEPFNKMHHATEMLAILARRQNLSQALVKAADKTPQGEDEPWPALENLGPVREIDWVAEKMEDVHDEPEPIGRTPSGDPIPRYPRIKGPTLGKRFFHKVKKPNKEVEAAIQDKLDKRRSWFLETPLGKQWLKTEEGQQWSRKGYISEDWSNEIVYEEE